MSILIKIFFLKKKKKKINKKENKKSCRLPRVIEIPSSNKSGHFNLPLGK